MQKNLIAIIIILILVAVGIGIWLWYSQEQALAPEELPQQIQAPVGTQDKTSDIEKDLESIDTLDLDREFEEIDKDLQNL